VSDFLRGGTSYKVLSFGERLGSLVSIIVNLFAIILFKYWLRDLDEFSLDLAPTNPIHEKNFWTKFEKGENSFICSPFESSTSFSRTSNT